MEYMSEELKCDYYRWKEIIGDDPYQGYHTVGILDVLRAHYLIVDFFCNEYGDGVGGIGPKDINILHSTISRQSSSYDKYVKFTNNFEVCATLFWGLIKNHPFHDVNKRTAFLTLLYHLMKIKRFPSSKQKEFETLAVRIASNELDRYTDYSSYKKKADPEILFIADFLRKNTQHLDRTEYFITYNELDTILRKNNYFLYNPADNRIDVVKLISEEVGFIRKSTRQTQKRVCTIGFPGWKKQVSKEEIKRVRKLTGLSVEDGVDSKAFFHGTDPLSTLISQFQVPLIRLAKK
jgi:death-on-curing family protein